MTEQEWETSEDLDRLLKWLQKSRKHRPTRRKLGLFACACASRLGERISDPFTLAGLNRAERMAERLASKDEVPAFFRESLDAGQKGPYAHIAVWVVRVLVNSKTWFSPETSARSAAGYIAQELGNNETGEQCRLLRDVIGNPYRPVTWNPAWRTRTVLAIAQGIYEERRFSDLPILADCLEDAGCDNAEVLDHCRGPGPHTKGCRLLDALLGKEQVGSLNR